MSVPDPVSAEDHAWMGIALRLASASVGDTAENPPVGCVLVKDGQLIGRGRTAAGGRPHAETEALKQAGEAARGATAYVTLEPCSHTGKTPPCTDALIKAGVARVVVAVGDPDPRVSGGGLAKLQAAGIKVTLCCREGEARRVMAGFLTRLEQKRPHITLKLAVSEDLRLSAEKGKPSAVTGEIARRRSHLIRARSDAILVGIGTVLADDPTLDCRLEGLEDRSPRPIILDAGGHLPKEAKLKSRNHLVFSSAEFEAHQGLETELVPTDAEGRLLLQPILASLAARGLGRLMVEGGAEVARAFIRQNLVDELALFRAPERLGGGGAHMRGEDGISAILTSEIYDLVETLTCGKDRLETYRRKA